MNYKFHRDFYNQIVSSIEENSVTFLLGTRKSGKTVCLRQVNDVLPNTQYIDFKTIPAFSDKMNVFSNIIKVINADQNRIFLLDEITYVPNAEAKICEIADAFTGIYNTNTKVVFTGSQSIALNTWADRAFAGNVGKVSVDFLTYSEFLRYKGLTEISPNTYNKFLYEVADFYNFKSLKDYLKGCIEETIISNANTSNYLFGNECDLIEDKVDVLINLCYQTMFTLHNHVSVDTFFKNNKLRDTIIGTFHEVCKSIGNDAVASKIENSFIGSYNNIVSQDLDTLKQSFVFLKRCGLISITPITDDITSVPNIYRSMRLEKSDVNCKKDLFKTFNITINHPMFYVQILKDILREDMPEKMSGSILGSIVECYARGLLPDGFEYHSLEIQNGVEREREIDYVHLASNSAIEFTISQDHSKNFEILPEYMNCICLTRNRNCKNGNVSYIDYCSYLYDLSKNKYAVVNVGTKGTSYSTPQLCGISDSSEKEDVEEIDR